MTQSRAVKAAILSLGNTLVKLTGVLSAVVLSRAFTKTDYAAYRQTFLAYNFVVPLLTLGLPSALFYFIPRDKENGRRLVSANLGILVLTGSLFMIAMWCGGNDLLARRFNNPSLRHLLLVFSPYALVTLPVTSVTACLIAYDKVRYAAAFNFISRLLAFAAVVLVILLWSTPMAAVVGQVVTEAIIFIPALVLMYRTAQGSQWLPAPVQMWEQLTFSVPLGLASMMGILSMNMDKVVVSSMCPPEQFAVYSNGAIELPVLSTITNSVMVVLLPEFAAMFKRGEEAGIVGLWGRAMVKCALIIFPIMAFLLVMAPEAMRVLFSRSYEASSLPFRVYLLDLPLRITTFGSIIMASGKSHLILVRSAMGLVLNLILSIILVRLMGYVGAAVATVAVLYLFETPYNMATISRLCHCPLSQLVPFVALGKIALMSTAAALLAAGANVAIRSQGDCVRLIVTGIAFSIVFLVALIAGGFVTLAELRRSVRRIPFVTTWV